MDGGEGFVFASGCEVNTFRVMLRELKDGLFPETNIAYAEERLARDRRGGLEVADIPPVTKITFPFRDGMSFSASKETPPGKTPYNIILRLITI